ncbi:DEAD/DEAH box helicase [Actibacterium pelagium]|uniref:RNA helicase n=1 Tax=Actibacterium pelagium TaxID=2029103 RepID=A0A917AAD2_9RHOB|nr:DEAD/DEAH box helicase [Actibacterium pelagium]GGE37748.1 RNA helicase [Actibacterium pelagium]
MSKFETLGLSPKLLQTLSDSGFTEPTPIQAQSIPLALKGHDIMGLAQTGTGKTLAFGLPMIDQLRAKQGKTAPKSAKALILAPTRELVNQIADNLRPLVKGTPMKVATVVGGQSINRQIRMLARGVDILVATPGRLIDLLDRKEIDLSTAKFLVLDEADQMLDMGFIHALRQIEPHLSKSRQTMLFSATMPKQIEQLSRDYQNDPKKVQVAPPGKTADKITQSVCFLTKAEKPVRLREILSEDKSALTLVFARTKHGAERMKKQLVAEGFAADSVHGNKSQGQRDRAIQAVRDGTVTVLVATDVAARGIDLPGVARVINYDLPNVPESYVHRIGRTARAGREGEAIAFCSSDERPLLRDIEKLIGRKIPGATPLDEVLVRKTPPEEAETPKAPNKPRRRRPGKKPQARGGNGNPGKRGNGQRSRGKGPRRRSNAA